MKTYTVERRCNYLRATDWEPIGEYETRERAKACLEADRAERNAARPNYAYRIVTQDRS